MPKDLEEPEREQELDDDGSFNANIGEKPDSSVVENLFNTQKRVQNLINSWSGNKKEDSIAGRKFLNNQYASLIGVINTTNSFTKRNGDECQAILYREVQKFILDLVNEPSIKREHYRTLTFTYWHTIELFLGLPRNGHGSRVLKDALAGIHTPEPEEKKQGLINWGTIK